MKNLFKRKNKITETDNDYMNLLTEEELLKIELKETTLALDAAYCILENVTEPELIDSAIYELNSIQSKYTYLSRKYRDTFS